LCGGRHHVRLVEDDQLETTSEERACFGELFDLIAHNINATIV
jgi:hypothetical protein